MEKLQQIRQSKVDVDNTLLWFIADDLAQYFTELLYTAAMPPGCRAGEFTVTPILLKCAHDTIVDPTTNERLTPHMIADCTGMCKRLADATAKNRLKDKTNELYEVTAAKKKKESDAAKKVVDKAQKKASTLRDKIDALAKTLSDATLPPQAVKKLKKSLVKTQGAFAKAEELLERARAEASKLDKATADAAAKATEVLQIQETIVQSWRAALEAKNTSGSAPPPCIESCQLYPPPRSTGDDSHDNARATSGLGNSLDLDAWVKFYSVFVIEKYLRSPDSRNIVNAGAFNLYLFLRLTREVFDLAREKFGDASRFGKQMPLEVPKSWTYLQAAWNTIARTPVMGVLESAARGDDKAVTFHMLSDGKRKKKPNKKQTNRLRLPKAFDDEVYKVAAVVNHFNRVGGAQSQLYRPIEHQPSSRERDHIAMMLSRVLANPSTRDLSACDVYEKHVLPSAPFASYRGPGWREWLIAELQCIRSHATPLLASAATSEVDHSKRFEDLTWELNSAGVSDPELIAFLRSLCTFAGHATCPFAIYKQWRKVLTQCSSHWYPPPLWWCVASTLVAENLDSMTRFREGGVMMAATCLENWDMLPLLKLLQTRLFPADVHEASYKIATYTRKDIAHERFDCDWHRDWNCMADLLEALSGDAEKLREFCESKPHSTDAG